ncbi:MAG: 3-deoxy-8-phosphooctulonate synthase, partial [Desulfobacterales bacterium]
MIDSVEVRDFFRIGPAHPLLLIAGPCVLESEEIARRIASHVKEVAGRLGISFVFKASFDKANRTSLSSYRGPGLTEGLRMLAAIRQEFQVPVISDVHDVTQVEQAAQVLDILQIPAFLCRQTDLLVAAARTGKVVNVKKGQFMAPWDMEHAV